MRKITRFNMVTFIMFIALFYGAYFFLTRDHFLPTSISSIISHSHDLEVTKHLIVLGLLPFYIAAVIFGTAMLSIYLSIIMRRWFRKWVKSNKSLSTENLA